MPTRRPGRKAGRADGPRLGRRPRRVQQSAAALVDVAVLDHDRLLARLSRRCIRGSAAFRACSAGRRPAQYERRNAPRPTRRLKPLYDKYAAMDLPAIAADPQARAMGERLFLNNCAQCHGSDARGATRLSRTSRDNDWLYGGAPETIVATITNGRIGVMPALGAVARRGRREERRRLRALAVGPARTTACGAARQAAVRAELRRLPRRGRQGQPGASARRTSPTRSGCTAAREATIAEGINKGRHLDVDAEHTPMPALKDRSGRRRSISSPPTSGACRTSPAPSDDGTAAGTEFPWPQCASLPARRRRRSWRSQSARAIPSRERQRPASRRPRAAAAAPPVEESRSTRSAGRSIRARCTAGSRTGAGRWCSLTQLDLLRPAVAHVERPPGGAVRPRRAQVLHLRPRVLAAGLHLPDGAADHLRALAVPVHRGRRPAVVRLRLPADRLHRDLPVDRAQDRRRPARRA